MCVCLCLNKVVTKRFSNGLGWQIYCVSVCVCVCRYSISYSSAYVRKSNMVYFTVWNKYSYRWRDRAKADQTNKNRLLQNHKRNNMHLWLFTCRRRSTTALWILFMSPCVCVCVCKIRKMVGNIIIGVYFSSVFSWFALSISISCSQWDEEWLGNGPWDRNIFTNSLDGSVIFKNINIHLLCGGG